MRILTEASGSLISAFMIKAIQSAGHEAIASDVDLACVGRYLADGFLQMPTKSDPELWDKVSALLVDARIDLVIPSFDEMLPGWAKSLHDRDSGGTPKVLLSPFDVIEIFLDKWKTFEFLSAHGIPTPKTSLNQKYQLVKPRFGRGGKGVHVAREPVDMSGYISQEIVEGEEYTVDVLCDNSSSPLYIVPRKRLGVLDGKSTRGVVVKHPGIEDVIRALCSTTQFRGPINVQCFCDARGCTTVVEVNPRVAGGMALGFAATENWLPLMVAMASGEESFDLKPIKYGLKMMRYYSEVFASDS